VIIDVQTLLVAAGIVVAISAISFILSTTLRRNESYGRTWCIAFVAGILETIASIVLATSPSGWWGSGVGNAAVVLALGLMWSGCRQFNERRSLVWIPLAASLLVAAVSLLQGPQGGYWAGAVEMFVGVFVFATLAGAETIRGHMRRAIDARALTIVFWLVALYYAVRCVIFVLAGETSDLFSLYFGTITTTLVAIVLVIVAAISMTAIQPPTTGLLAGARSGSRGLVIEGVSGPETFEAQVRDWLVRSRRDHETLVLLTLSVEGLDDITSAFGREFADQTIRTVGRIACEYSPAAALVAHSGRGRFLVLTLAPSVGSATTIAERLQTALVETPVDTVQGIRAITTIGLATTDESGYDYTELVLAAGGALRTAAEQKPGSIVAAG